MKRMAEEGKIADGPEAVKAIAAELGFELSLEEIEQALAAVQELDIDELEEVAGGYEKPEGEDEYGHDSWCWTIWHCHGITCHNDSNDGKSACWANYVCMAALSLNPRRDSKYNE